MLKIQMPGPHLGDFNSVCLGWDKGVCMFKTSLPFPPTSWTFVWAAQNSSFLSQLIPGEGVSLTSSLTSTSVLLSTALSWMAEGKKDETLCTRLGLGKQLKESP